MVRLREVILLAALALLVLGVVMVSSASMNVSPVALDGGGPATAVAADGVTLSSILTGRPVIYMAIAALAFTLGALLPVQRLAAILDEAPTPTPGGTLIGLVATAFAFTAVLVLVYVPGLGREVNFSHRWIAVPGAGSLQPSEVVKWAMLIALAVYAAAIRERITMFGLGLMPALAMLGFVSALVAVEDLGTGVLIAASGTLVLIAAGARLWQIGLLAPFGLAGVYGFIASSTYRTERITAFLDPFVDPQGNGYHMIQSLATIAGGGPFGRGLGHGLQKFGYLPEDTTDFVFAIICEELGIAGAALVASLYVLLVGTVLAVARRTRTRALQLIAVGVGATIALQATINLFVVTGLGPTKGIALPLLSAGGTGWVLTALMLGIVWSIDRAADAERGLAARSMGTDRPSAEPALPR